MSSNQGSSRGGFHKKSQSISQGSRIASVGPRKKSPVIESAKSKSDFS